MKMSEALGGAERGLPYMTSAQKGGIKNAPNMRTNSIDCAYREGKGVKKAQHYVDVIYVSPQSPRALAGHEGNRKGVTRLRIRLLGNIHCRKRPLMLQKRILV